MVRLIALSLALAASLSLSAAVVAPAFLAQRAGQRAARGAGCAAEGRKPEADRATACKKCAKFRDAHPDSKHVQPNAGLCTKCFSMKSSCGDGQFAWTCYDVNEQFEVFKVNGNKSLDEPKE